MDQDGSPAPDAAANPAPEADQKPTYETTNDLDYEMTPEQEKAFVDSTLGITEPVKEEPKDGKQEPAGEPEPAPTEPETPEVPKEEPKSEPPAPAPVEPAKVEEPEPVVEPGAVDTSDLWIEVENSDGKSVKITLDGGLPDDFQFKSDKQLYEVMESMREMKDLREERLADQEAKTEQAAAKASQDDQLSTWDNEAKTLIDAGLIPEPKLKAPANGKQFTAEEIENDPSLKIQNEVYVFMKTENDKRIAEGKPPIHSFGTMFNIHTQQQKNDAEAKKKEEEAKLTKERGAMIGGTSAASGGEKPAYVAGSHANIWSVPVNT